MSLEGTAKAKNVLVGKVSLVDVIQGDSAYEVAVSNGFKGTEEEWLASLKGEKGDTGEKGDKGDRGEKGEKGDSGSGTGDMLASMYDPQGKKTDIFAELANKAPAGFGLGGTAIVAEDANTISANGYYTTTVNGPGGVRCYIYHMQYTSSPYAWQYASTVNASVQVTAIRHKVNGTWGEWEWVNPPMNLGVEYRTTERYLGKPVYRKLIQYTQSSASPETGSISIPHGISNFDGMVSISAKAGIYPLPYVGNTGGITGVGAPNATNVGINTYKTSWSTAYAFTLDMRYTKTTD